MASMNKTPNPHLFALEFKLRAAIPAAKKWLLRFLAVILIAAIYCPYQPRSYADNSLSETTREELIAKRVLSVKQLTQILDACLSGVAVVLHDGSAGHCNFVHTLPAEPEFKAAFFLEEIQK